MGAALVVAPQTLWKLGLLERVARGTPLLLVADVVNGVGESRYSGLREPGAAGSYQVTAGATLVITHVRVSGSILNVAWLIGSGTADAGDSQAAAPAGAAAEDARADGVANARVGQAALTVQEYETYITVAAGRYAFTRNLTASSTLRVECLAVEL